MEIKEINQERVSRIRPKEVETRPVKGRNLFEECYGNIALIAKKKSGKTTVIANILKKCVNRKSVVYIFASTVNLDPAYEHMIDWMNNKGIEYHTYTSLMEGKTNVLAELLEKLDNTKAEVPESPEEEKKDKLSYISAMDTIESEEEEDKPREYKPRHLAPEVVFILDDLSKQLANPAVETLMKKNRHYKSKTLIAGQNLKDLVPAARQQLDYAILFGGIPLERIATFYEDSDISHVSLTKFVEMYRMATAEKYSFLWVDIRNERFRIKFNREIIVTSL